MLRVKGPDGFCPVGPGLGDDGSALAGFAAHDRVERLGHVVHRAAAVQRRAVVAPRAQDGTRVPRAPTSVHGVINLRGRVVTVIELKALLGLAAAKLGVPVEELRIEDGLVAGKGQRMTFAEACKLIKGPKIEVRAERIVKASSDEAARDILLTGRTRQSGPPGDVLRRFYLDTVSHHAPAYRCALDTWGADRLLLGSDITARRNDGGGKRKQEQSRVIDEDGAERQARRPALRRRRAGSRARHRPQRHRRGPRAFDGPAHRRPRRLLRDAPDAGGGAGPLRLSCHRARLVGDAAGPREEAGGSRGRGGQSHRDQRKHVHAFILQRGWSGSAWL